MKFKKYLNNLSEDELQAYAERAGTTPGYITTHLLHARKTPRKDLLNRLADATEKKVAYSEVLDHFYSSEEQGAA